MFENELNDWWTQGIKIADLREVFRTVVANYKDDEDDDEHYAEAAQEGLSFLRGKRSDDKLYRQTIHDKHLEFIFYRAALCVLNDDNSLFVVTCADCEDAKKIHYYQKE